MILWTNEDINRILLQLDAKKLPFEGFTLSKNGSTPKLIGRGGSANVYEAYLRADDTMTYAMKVIGFSNQSVDSACFNESVEAQQEIWAASDNVVRIYDHSELWLTLDSEDNLVSADYVKPDNLPRTAIKLQFIVMEQISPVIERTKAGNIKMNPQILAEGDEKEILRMAYDIGFVLKQAHADNVLHRDVKLENIFYSQKDKKYKLGDFGIAKKTEDGFAGTIAFTKGYAAPEVRGMADNDRYDNTADIYSFGMMLYVLANRLRFPDSNTYNVNSEVQYSKGYVLPMPDNDGISERLYLIMQKACMYDPDLRYQSMDEMLHEIESLMYGNELGFKREHRIDSFIIGAVLLGIGAVLWKLTYASGISINLSLPEYVFLLSGVGKTMLKVFKKRTGFISVAMFCIGIYLLILGGFSPIMFVLMLYAVLSRGEASGYICGGTLLINLVSIFQSHKYVATLPPVYGSLALTMISLSWVLFLQYALLVTDDRKYVVMLYQKRIYWSIVFAAYTLIFLNGILDNPAGKLFTSVGQKMGLNVNSAIMQGLLEINYVMIGLLGAAFCVFWLTRWQVLAYFNKKIKNL